MKVSELCENALISLRGAGWSPQRALDPAPFIETLRRHAFHVSKPALDFLSCFGGLTLRYPHHAVPTHEDGCHFHVESACEHACIELIQEYESAVGQPMSVIGEAYHEHMTMTMAESGAVYGGFEDTLVRIGFSGVEALNVLCSGREPESVPYEIPLPQCISVALEDETVRRLEAGGWTSGRQVKLADIHDRVAEALGVSPAGLAFLEEFDGVQLQCRVGSTSTHEPTCAFSADAWRCINRGEAANLNHRAQRKVLPVGRFDVSKIVILAGDDGRIYATLADVTDLIWLAGASPNDALNRLVRGDSWLQRIS